MPRPAPPPPPPTDAELELLRVFLTSRGNLKELEKHLGVSYPTARARFNDLLATLGLDAAASEGGTSDGGASEGGASDGGASDEGETPGGPDARAQEGADAEPSGAPTPSGAADGTDSAGPTAHEDEPEPEASDSGSVRDQVLAQVASGALAPDVAADLLRRLG